MPRQANAAGGVQGPSLKLRVLDALASCDGPIDVPALQARVGADRHTLVHLIWSLQKQAMVSFTLSQRGRRPRAIVITDPGRAAIADGRS